MRGFVLGGVNSGVGKTIATLATIRAIDRSGKTVQPAKAGSDFIDPSHHERVAGRPSRTLDLWLCGEEGVRRNYYRGEGDIDGSHPSVRGTTSPDICIIEGVMGLYDGDGSSTAMIAEALDLPIVLVVDASAGMESVAATALGFREYASHADREIEVAGIIAQRAHGGRHEQGIRDALPEGIEYFGRIEPRENLEIPDRHLGLRMGGESPLSEEALDAASEHLLLDRLLDVARAPPRPETEEKTEKTGKRIGVAQDAAFCFYYPATVERFAECARMEPFSPVAGDDLPDCDAVYLPGGYPELHAEALSESSTLETLSERASDGLAVFGECGGLMALSESLTTAEGETYSMAGVLPAKTKMHERYQALDHVELRAVGETLTADSGKSLRGHEFHYSSAEVDSDARFAFEVERGKGIDGAHDGLTEHRTLGTYCHVHPEGGAFDTLLDRL